MASLDSANIYIYHKQKLPPSFFSDLEALFETWSLQSPDSLGPDVTRLFVQANGLPLTPQLLHKTRLEASSLEQKHNVELVLLPSSLRSTHNSPRIAVFDLDSTLIAAEVIDELARSIGVMPEVAAITERAMNGEIDFAESLKLRVALLKGVEVPQVWDELKQRIQFMPGARELCRALRRMGLRLAVFSGGFVPMAMWVAEQLGIERVAANQLVSAQASGEFPFEHLTGELDDGAIIITAERKREFVKAFAAEYGVPLSQVMCVGDGANDLLMLGEVWSAGGLAIAYRAKQKVQMEAGNRYNGDSLRGLLYLFGKTEKEIEDLTKKQGPTVEQIMPKLMPGLRIEK